VSFIELFQTLHASLCDVAMNPLLTVERVPEAMLADFWSKCTDLAKRMAYPSFFCTGDWLKAAGSLLAKESLLILIVKMRGNIQAVLPLVRKRNKLGGVDLHFLGMDFYPDPLGLICASSDRAACAAVLKEYLLKIPGWDRLILDWILEDELTDWGLPGKRVSIEPFKKLPNSFEGLLETFKKKKRYNMRAGVRSLLDAGATLVRSTETATHNYFFDNLCLLHNKRALERKLDSSFVGQRVERLHRQLINGSDKIRFYGLQLNDTLIAVIYGFEFCNCFFYYQVAHDPSFKEAGPGSALLFLVIEDCCSRGVAEFNFLQGNESYKGVWTDDSRELYRIVFNHGTCRSALLKVLERAKGFTKSCLKRSERGH